MTLPAKPKLHNGFKITENLFIKKRIERAFFIEIYELSDNNFLYLIINQQPDQIEHKVKNHEILHNFKQIKDPGCRGLNRIHQ